MTSQMTNRILPASMPILVFVFLICPCVLSVCAQTYDIRSFGAVADGKTINTSAIQSAIDSCRRNGGGTVVVPAGTYLTGTIQLFGSIELRVETGGVLKGSANLSDYYLNGRKLGLIYTENSESVSITGGGDIDGNGDAFVDLKKAKVMDSSSTKYTREGSRFREVRSGLGDGPLVPLDRPFQMIIFSNCRNVSVRDVTISNSPFWTLHLADCDGAIISGVRIWNNIMIPNNDGIDLTSCSNVEVSDCDIRTGDDAIAITGYAYHFDLPGYNNLIHDSENITVSNCNLESRSSAIRIGGWDQNNMRNYTFSNIVISNSNRGINLCVRDQGSIEEMTFSNMVIHTRLFTGDWWGNGEPIHISAIRGKDKVTIGNIGKIKFSHIICTGESGILVYGTDESWIHDVTFDDVDFTLQASPLNETCGGNFDLRPVIDQHYSIFKHDVPCFYGTHVKSITLRNVDFGWGRVTESYFTHGIELSDFENVTIENSVVDPSPSNRDSSAVLLKNGSPYRLLQVRSDEKRVKLLDKSGAYEN